MSPTDHQLDEIDPKHIEPVLVPVRAAHQHHALELAICPSTVVANVDAMPRSIIDLTHPCRPCAGLQHGQDFMICT